MQTTILTPDSPRYVMVKGRPPSATLQEPYIKFCTSSKLQARKAACGTKTHVSAFTSIIGGKYGGLQEITCIRTKQAGGEDEDDAVVDCPWTSELPYVISDWSDGHVRIDCLDDMAFWCELPQALLPAASLLAMNAEDAQEQDM
jgi:hypothetical protein